MFNVITRKNGVQVAQFNHFKAAVAYVGKNLKHLRVVRAA